MNIRQCRGLDTDVMILNGMEMSANGKRSPRNKIINNNFIKHKVLIIFSDGITLFDLQLGFLASIKCR